MLFSCASHRSLEKSYYDDGKIRYEIEKENDKLHGLTKYWDEEGDLINEVEYLNDKLHGDWIEYYKTGKIKLPYRAT